MPADVQERGLVAWRGYSLRIVASAARRNADAVVANLDLDDPLARLPPLNSTCRFRLVGIGTLDGVRQEIDERSSRRPTSTFSVGIDSATRISTPRASAISRSWPDASCAIVGHRNGLDDRVVAGAANACHCLQLACELGEMLHAALDGPGRDLSALGIDVGLRSRRTPNCRTPSGRRHSCAAIRVNRSRRSDCSAIVRDRSDESLDGRL